MNNMKGSKQKKAKHMNTRNILKDVVKFIGNFKGGNRMKNKSSKNKSKKAKRYNTKNIYKLDINTGKIKTRKLNKGRVFICSVILILFIITIVRIVDIANTPKPALTDEQVEGIKELVKEVLEENKTNETKTEEQSVEEPQTTEETPVVEETPVSQPQASTVTSRSAISRQVVKEETATNTDNSLTGYRITSYYAGDGYDTNARTGSGKTTSDFDTMIVSGKTVYTYQGKIVVATATKELLATGYNVKGSQEPQVKHYFKYYDTGKINIDGTLYDFIVLDSCGASMWKGEYRIDIFVPDASNVINRSNVTVYYN